jgi:hypothetical protein
MITRTFNNITFLNVEILENTLRSGSFSAYYQYLTSLKSSGVYTLDLYFSDTLVFTPELETELSNIIATHQTTAPSSFDYLFNFASKNTQEANIQFGTNLLFDWMRRNTLEGMTVEQSLWMFSRFEDFYVSTGNFNKRVDIFKMFTAGAIPTVFYCLLKVEPDDMTQPYHWLTEVRMGWVIERVEAYLGAGMAGYIRSLP